jgi:hypothetical protein
VGVTPVRTSSTSWCNVQSCLEDEMVRKGGREPPVPPSRCTRPTPYPTPKPRFHLSPQPPPHILPGAQVQEIRQRISNLTKVPWKYAEHLQLLK